MLKGFFLQLSLLIASSPTTVGYRVEFKDVCKLHSLLYRRPGFGKLSRQARPQLDVELDVVVVGRVQGCVQIAFLVKQACGVGELSRQAHRNRDKIEMCLSIAMGRPDQRSCRSFCSSV